MSAQLLRRCSAVGLLVLAGSCSDLLGPRTARSGSALKTIDVTVATLSVDLVYDGASIGAGFAPPGTTAFQGDRCFTLTVDGTFQTQVCGTTEIQNLPPGVHTIALQDLVPPPPGTAIGTFVDVQPPVSVDLAGGTSTPVVFDISGARGKLTGTVLINGEAPGFAYSVCIDGGSCGSLESGEIAMFARPGAGVLHVRRMPGSSNILDIPFTAEAGATVDVGDFNVEFGSVALDILYNDESIGQGFGPPGTSVVQGDRCFTITVDGVPSGQQACGATTLADLTPGDHTIGLQDLVPPPPGTPIGTFVDVQPPIAVTIVGGESTPVAFDISAVRGKLTGTVLINGEPPGFAYSVCIDGGSCGSLETGEFAMFARPGTGVLHVRRIPGSSNILDIPFTAEAGATVDVGDFNVEFGSVALDILYNDESIGQGFGPPGTSVVQGDRCFTITVDGMPRGLQACGSTTLTDLTPGDHTIGLQDLVPPPPGTPIGTFVDVQPPIAVTIIGGESTPVVFDISAVRGKIAGAVRINGAPPPDFQYQICILSSACGELVGGEFTLFARVGAGDGALRVFGPGSTTLAQFSFIVAAGNTTLIGGVSTAAPGSTPAGSGVSVQPVNQTTGTSNATVGLTFDNVSTSGTTTVVQSNTGAPPPAGLQLGTPPVFFDISTTATFSGPVEVCINYTGTTFDPGAAIELLHGEPDGSWTVVTTSHDAVNRIICGSVTSFSPFVVAGRTGPVAEPPGVTAMVEGTLGAAGWYTSDVSVSWQVAGNGATITSRSGCDAVTISDDTSGITLTCTASSAGGTTTESVTIKRDATNPAVSYAGNAGVYALDQSIAITCTATDATSGVAATSCQDLAGPAYTFAAGMTTVSAAATDNAGNTGTGSATFQVSATADALCRLTKEWTSSGGVANSLCAKLEAAAASLERGNATAAANQMRAYRNELAAQAGKKISAEHAAILARWSAAL